jgi:DNA-binding CsgD family transcriptional regulator/tetratricopeptide (TPR) repeat protein
MIGRDEQARALVDFAATLREGEPRIALIAGRAGSGKTRLVTEAGARLRERRLRVLGGACLLMSTAGPPYLPLLTALRAGLPAEAPVLAALTGTRRVNRTQLFELIRLAVEGLARRERLILVMEDVHWADRATQDALLYLVGQATSGRWGLIATFRPEGRAAVGTDFVATLERRSALRLSLGTLSVDEVRAQAAAITGVRPSADEASLIYRRSGGIPLLVEEVVAAGTRDVPDHLRAMFLARVSALGEVVADVVGVCAVVDRGCDEDAIARILGRSVRQVREAAVTGVEWDLLIVDDHGYRIRHDLLKEAVYDALPPGHRRDLHGRVAQVLSRTSPQVPAELAHHWQRAGQAEESAEASLVAAASAERAQAPSAAHTHLQRVISLWPLMSDDLRARAGGRDEILRRAAVAAERDGAFADAVALTEERIMLDAGRPLVWERLARYRWQGGDGPGAQAAYEKAVEILPPDAPPEVQAKVLSGQAWFLGVSAQPERAAQLSDRALAAGTGIRDETVRWQVLLSWGIARLDRQEGLTALEEARRVAVSLDAGYEVAISDLWRNVSLRNLGRFRECEAVLTTGIRYVAAHGLGRSVEAALLYMVAELMLELGRWDEAAAAIDANRGRGVQGVPGYFTSGYRARLAAWRGEGDVLAEACAETSALAAAIPQQPLPRAIALLGQAESHLWSGRSEEAVSLAVEALGHAGADPYCRVDALATLVRAEADAAATSRMHGRTYVPELSVDEILRRVREWSLPDHDQICAFMATVRAEVERLNGSRDPSPWSDAVNAWLAGEDPYRLAYARWRLGWALLGRRSGRSGAAEQLELARETASALGAEPLRTAIDDLVKASRLHVGRVPGQVGPPALEAGLTSRELEVLPLLAAGRSNVEIAEILVISPRTVGVHVSRILHKLGASRRTEAADIARRTGLLDR